MTDEMKLAIELAQRAMEIVDGCPASEWEDEHVLARALLASQAEIERMTKYVAHNDEEYMTMKDVLRAEHQECQRLRAEVERMRPVYEAANRYTDTTRELQTFAKRGATSLAAMSEHDRAHRDVMSSVDAARNADTAGTRAIR